MLPPTLRVKPFFGKLPLGEFGIGLVSKWPLISFTGTFCSSSLACLVTSFVSICFLFSSALLFRCHSSTAYFLTSSLCSLSLSRPSSISFSTSFYFFRILSCWCLLYSYFFFKFSIISCFFTSFIFSCSSSIWMSCFFW